MEPTQTTPVKLAGEEKKTGCCHKLWPTVLLAVIITALVAGGGTYFALMQKMVKDRAAVAISVRSGAQSEIAQAQGQVEALQEKIKDLQKENRTDKEEKRHYKSFNLGIEFDYSGGEAYEKGNELGVLNGGGVGTITVFDKSSDETIEEAIKKLISKEGKNPDDCKIVQGNTDNCSGNKCWHITLATPHTPTQEELDKLGAKGIYSNLIKAMAIENKTNEACSSFSPGPGPGAGLFIYDPENSETKFIYLYSYGLDPFSFNIDSIRFGD